MKQNKIFWALGLMLSFYSCLEMEDLSSDLTFSSSVTTRSAGDEKYDVLGYGYDVTGEYLHPLSVRNPVLDIKRYEQDYFNRLQSGTSSFGYDRMYYGYSSSDYVKDITTDTKATSTMGYGSDKDTAFFSSTISNNDYLKTQYSYSDKYSFASLDAIRNLKYIHINDEVSRLSQYLSDDFKEDLNRLSPDRIVERYGTHVLVDFIIGGRYKLLFRSVITNTRDASTKRSTVSSGFKSSLDKIGFSYNLESSETIDESMARENQYKELYVLFYGGSGTNMRYDLEKGGPTSVDIQSWEKSVSLGNSCLTNINWKETHPIYDFISDPTKKEQIKVAVLKYIKASQLKELKLKLLYSYDYEERKHLVTIDPGIADRFPDWRFLNHEGYILAEQIPGTIPLYEYKNDRTLDFYETTISNYNIINPLYEKTMILGYVYKNMTESTVPFYEYYHAGNVDHLTTMNPIIATYDGWVRLNPPITGYVYPNG